jgi:hypothetical protein
MNDIDKLLAIEEIKQLKARYFRCIDTHSFDELRTVFASDGVLDVTKALLDPVHGMPDGIKAGKPISGAEKIVESASRAMRNAQSAHHGHEPEIDFTSDTTAKAIWPMEDVVKMKRVSFRGFGHYFETYEKGDEGWRIKTSELTRLRVIVEN